MEEGYRPTVPDLLVIAPDKSLPHFTQVTLHDPNQRLADLLGVHYCILWATKNREE